MARLDDPPTAQGSADPPPPRLKLAESPDLEPPTPGHPPLGAVSPPSTSTPPPGKLTTSPDALSDLSSPPTSATSPNPLASPPKPRHLPPLSLPATSSSSPSNSPAPSPGGPASPSLPSRPSRPSSRPPSSRPPSRPPSVTRPPSVSRPPSVRRRSSASMAAAGDSRRLSAASASGGNVPPASPRIPEDSVLLASSTSSSSSSAAAAAAATLAPDADPAPTPAEIAADVPGGPTADDNEVPVLVIRDYAFARDDPRFEGRQLPEEVEAERERERRFRAERDEGERLGAAGLGGAAGGAAGGSGFHWGFVTSHSSDFPQSSDLSDTSSSSGSPPGGYAFDDSELASSSSGAALGLVDGDAALDGEGEGGWPSDGIDGELELGEFVPGVYAALYEFEPELDTEMRLEAGEMVSVFERQCAGWVQAGRIVDSRLTGEVGLVPENYLELVEPNPQVEAEGEPELEEGQTGLEVRNGVEGEKGSLVDDKAASTESGAPPPPPQAEVAAAAGS
ncbi:hypothetical protein JCM8208_001290 [Rhodotorula glutinis]